MQSTRPAVSVIRAGLFDLGSADGERRAEPPHGESRAYPPLSELSDLQRREFHEALLKAETFEDLPGKWQAAILKAEESWPKLRLISSDPSSDYRDPRTKSVRGYVVYEIRVARELGISMQQLYTSTSRSAAARTGRIVIGCVPVPGRNVSRCVRIAVRA